MLYRLLTRVLHRFAHSWPLSAFQNFSKTRLQVLFRHFPKISLQVLFSHLLKNWPISTLQICSKLACNCLSSYLLPKMACMYFLCIFTHVACTSFTNSPETVRHFSDVYRNWPINAFLTSSHSYSMHTFLSTLYYCTVYSIVWSPETNSHTWYITHTFHSLVRPWNVVPQEESS